MQPNTAGAGAMIIDRTAAQAVNPGCLGEAGLQARADATVTEHHSEMPSNALQCMLGQKVPTLSPT